MPTTTPGAEVEGSLFRGMDMRSEEGRERTLREIKRTHTTIQGFRV